MQTITHPNSEKSTLQLAERGTRLTNGLWVREIRALTWSSISMSAGVVTHQQSAPTEPAGVKKNSTLGMNARLRSAAKSLMESNLHSP